MIGMLIASVRISEHHALPIVDGAGLTVHGMPCALRVTHSEIRQRRRERETEAGLSAGGARRDGATAPSPSGGVEGEDTFSSAHGGPRTSWDESSTAHPWDGGMRVLVVDRVLLLGAWVQEEDALQHFTQESTGQLLPLNCHSWACGREGGSCCGGGGSEGHAGEGQSSLELAPHEIALRIHPDSSCAGRFVVWGVACGHMPCVRLCARVHKMRVDERCVGSNI